MKNCWLFGMVLFVFQFSIIPVYGEFDFSVWQDLILRPCQCHGDAEGKHGAFWVGPADASMMQALYGRLPAIWPEDGVLYNPNLDFDRNFVINDLDVTILETWLNKLNVPEDCGKKLELTEVSPSILMANNSYTINWTWNIYTEMPGATDHPGTLSLYYSTNSGTDWTLITNITSGSNCNWSVPAVDSNNCMLKIVDNLHAGLTDATIPFNIHTCPVLIDGDFNNDCYVNFRDFATFAQNWLLCANPYDSNCTE